MSFIAQDKVELGVLLRRQDYLPVSCNTSDLRSKIQNG